MSKVQTGRPDVDIAAERMTNTIGSKREIRKLVEHLWDGEVVRSMATGTYGGGTGLLTLTDRRLIFLRDGWTSKAVEDFPVDRISSVQWTSGMLTGTVTIFVSGNKSEIKNVNKDDGKSLSDQARADIAHLQQGQPSSTPSWPQQQYATPPQPPVQYAQPQQPPPYPPPPVQREQTPRHAAGGDPMATLKQLAQMHGAGLITDDEYQSKRAEVLNRM